MTRSSNADSRAGTAASAEGDHAIELYDDELEAAVRAEVGEEYDDYVLITHYLANELTAAERERVEDRLRSDAKFRALAEPLLMVWNRSVPLEREEDLFDRGKAKRGWERLREQIQREEEGIHSLTLGQKRARWRRLRNWVFTTIGLTVATWLGNVIRQHWVPVPSAYVHADASETEQRAMNLPDETQVILAAGSHLSYLHWFGDADEHGLNLDGEATFTIAAGSRHALTVQGPGVEVRASAGQFRVHAFASEPFADVEVYDGHAQVRPRTLYGYGAILELGAGERARVGPGLTIQPSGSAGRPGNISSGATPAPRVSPPSAKQSSAPPHQEFISWPPELAARAPALADAIERDFGDRPYQMAFVGRDRIDIYFWDPSFWRANRGRKLPEESLPMVRKAAQHIAWYVLGGFGREAGVNQVQITFIRAREESHLGLTRKVPAQNASSLFTRGMFEPGSRERPTLAISQR